MPAAAVGIAYLDGPRLRRCLLAAADWVDAAREELNRINVFPVPDGDTGTNFAMTMRAVATSVRALDARATLEAVSNAMAQACVFSARGNSGMLLSQFLLGFRDRIAGLESATAEDVAAAMRAGYDRLFESLDTPVEGTILTVSREAAAAAEHAASETGNVAELMRRVLENSQRALKRTPELLTILKEAGVVDAGASAFVRVIEAIVRLIEGDPIVAAEQPADYAVPDIAAMAEVATDRDYHYCTEVLVRNENFPPSIEVRAALRALGGSIVVLATGDLLKVHVHTDTPEKVYELGRSWGTLEATKADDMREQHRQLSEAHRGVTILVDSSCDIPDDLLDRYGIVVVPIQLMEENRTYLDRIEIHSQEVYDRMHAGSVFTTSQPTPAAFVQGFQDALSGADEVVAVLLAKALSGTFASGQAAAQTIDAKHIEMVDSRSASLGVGMLALRAAELAEQGWTAGAIAREVQRIRSQSGGIFTVDTFDNLLRSGRVGRGRAWLGTLLDVKPILELNPEGRVVPLDKVRGREALIPRVIEHLERRLTPRPEQLRIGIVHAGAPDVAEQLRDEVQRRFAPQHCLMNDITPAIGVHVGFGAWGIFYQVEDPSAPPAS